ncbi:hypothetical protein [Ralstonia pseudosolanacearum]|uniref:Uncharacterized protein n=1 Tax=Ralstonia solanacearum TaxID=305 RepID=A0AA92JYE6_RALSL|nr:hypothetical protein [Ralstonia pseudosolanacearum]QOK90038.1 hypothetical protein HF908_00040 [Ralstonia pseudosolanacearum]QOK94998.1 hypothetical protein HF909_00045 [Ralstonia pseudosolanacearum]UWD90969.1 hypothetical protein NY025_07800 [Ralstonia pseudosolanacearum]CAH0442628.1 hypothetical protein LMG9673_03443 [Ralstonia pseudosolanacearum]
MLATTLNGKTFSRKNKSDDSDKFYGKGAFARDVVAKQASSIDFTKFRAILDRVVKALDDYEKRQKK